MKLLHLFLSFFPLTKWLGISVMMLIGVSGCITPFTPNTTGFSDLLVVEGRMRPGAEPAVVLLSRSFGLDETEATPEEGAIVRIQQEGGPSYLLLPTAPGRYESNPTQLLPQPGTSYRLLIEDKAGRSYESDWQVQKKNTPIAEVFAEFSDKVLGTDTIQGMQVFVSANDPEGTTRYYRYEYEENWLFSVPYPSRGDWNFFTNTYTFYEGDSIPVTCYGFNPSSEIILKSTVGLSEDRFEGHPVNFVSVRTPKLSRRYSILVRQYSLTEDIYRFWQNAEQVSENVGSLFDPVPTNVIGNITCIDDPNQLVLGFFSAEGLTEKRIFIDRRDFTPRVQVSNGQDGCDLLDFATATDMSAHVSAGGSFVGVRTDFFGNIVGFTGSTPICSDCRLQGTLKKPSWWVD